jgi:hypothetical protein
MKAAVVALKEFNGKQPCMGNVYMIMRALRHHVAALHNAPFNMPNDVTNNHRCRMGHVRQDLVRHAEETYTDTSTGGEEVDTR